MSRLVAFIFCLTLNCLFTIINGNSQLNSESLSHVSSSGDTSPGNVWPQPQSMQSSSDVSNKLHFINNKKNFYPKHLT